MTQYSRRQEIWDTGYFRRPITGMVHYRFFAFSRHSACHSVLANTRSLTHPSVQRDPICRRSAATSRTPTWSPTPTTHPLTPVPVSQVFNNHDTRNVSTPSFLPSCKHNITLDGPRLLPAESTGGGRAAWCDAVSTQHTARHGKDEEVDRERNSPPILHRDSVKLQFSDPRIPNVDFELVDTAGLKAKRPHNSPPHPT